MARRIPTIEVPLTADIPPGNVTASEWTEAKSDLAVAYDEAQLSQTRTYDTRAFPTIQDAIDTAHTNGGGTVFLGESELTPQTLTLRDGVYLTGRGIGATVLKVHSIVGSGSITALPSMSVSAAARARTITFSAAHGLVPGDVFCIYDTNDFSFSSARAYYRRGEFCRVSSVSGNTVTLTRPLYLDAGTYHTGMEMWKLNPIRTGVSNMSIECTTGQTGITVNFGSDLEFHNLKMSGSDVSHLTLSRCYGVTISKFAAFDNQAAISLNYGINIANSQRIRISDVDLETRRHGLTTGHNGPAAQPCLVPVRDVIVSDSNINGLSTVNGVCGCNLHGNAEHIKFQGCTFPSGANPAGNRVEYDHCTFGSPAWGSAVSMMETVGVDFAFRNCKFVITDTFQLVRGALYMFFDVSTSQPNGSFVFENNTVDLGAAAADSAGTPIALYVLLQSSSGNSANWRAYIRNNVFEAAIVTDRLAVRMVSSQTDTWATIDYVENTGRIAGRFSFASAGTLPFFEGHGAAVPTFAAQRGSTYRRRVTAGTNTGKLYVNENGDSTWTVK